MRVPVASLAIILLLGVPSSAMAWGCVGHQVVAYIASQNLNPTVAAKVADLLSDAEYGNVKRFCPFTDLGKMEYFSTWADDARTGANADWHFWDIPRSTATASMPQFCDQGCVVSALRQQVGILISDGGRRDRQQALIFIIHLVGDSHQPMHVIDNGDRGGNCVPVSFEYTGFSHETSEKKNHGQPTGNYSPNLHSIWDDNIIETMTGLENDSNRDQLTQAFAESIAHEYASAINDAKAEPVDVQTGSRFETWALETHKLAGPNSYDQMPSDIPAKADPKTLKSCVGVSSQFAALKEVADDDFVNNARPIVRKQLALAGARLAATLNAIWPAQ